MLFKNKRKEFLKFVVAYHVVLFIPLIILTLSGLAVFKRQQEHRMDGEAYLMLERQESYWNQQMGIIKSFNTKCKYDKKYNELYSNEPNIYFDVREGISEQESNFPFVRNISVYDEEKGLVITADGIWDKENFFDKRVVPSHDVFNEVKDFAISASDARIVMTKGIVLSALINTWNQNGTGKKYILYTVSERTLNEQFGGNAGLESILLFRDYPIYLSPGAKKEFENTDGKREGFYGRDDLTDEDMRNKYYIYERNLGEGFSLLGLAKKSDLTRGMSIYINTYLVWFLCSVAVGIALAFKQSGKGYKKYIRALDYSEELERERNTLRQRECVYSILSGEIAERDKVWNKCLESGIEIERNYKLFIVTSSEAESEDLYRKFEEIVENMGETGLYSVETASGVRVYLLCSDAPVEKINDALRQMIKLQPHMVTSDRVSDVKKLWYSYKEAKNRYDGFYNDKKEYPKSELSALKEAIEEEDSLRTTFLIGEIKEYIETAGDIEIRGIIWDITHIFKKGSYEISMLAVNDTDMLRNQAYKILDSMIPEVDYSEKNEDKKPQAYKKRNIVDILRYVHDHYIDENFSIKYMAAFFDTSMSNISHFFKKNMGITVSQYIEQIKLDRAKELLTNTDKTVADIAQELRYANSTAFIEMFKKNEGVTPGAYRENYSNERN